MVLQALDLKRSTATDPLGVQVVIFPAPGNSLATFSALVLRAVRKQPIVGSVAERVVRLSVGPARLLRYRVRVKPQDVVVDDYVLAVRGKNILVTFLVPYSRADEYKPIFARSVASFRAH